jgi:transposase
MHLRRAKNDKLDAVLIAACAVSIKQSCSAPDGRLVKLAGQLTFVEQIDVNVVRFKTRLEQIATDGPGDITRLKARRAAEPLQIAAAKRAHHDLARRLALVLGDLAAVSARRLRCPSACAGGLLLTLIHQLISLGL